MCRMIGFAMVAILMIAIYLLPGFAAVLALGIYVLMMALVLNGFDITLTLPGIAGILLSVGMAVDANVIIFARIREELATGIGVKTAINNEDPLVEEARAAGLDRESARKI